MLSREFLQWRQKVQTCLSMKGVVRMVSTVYLYPLPQLYRYFTVKPV
jgi:hypothetical protein